MLKKTRLILAIIFFAGISLLLAGIGAQWWGWMAKLQFLPSCLALNFAVIAGVLLVTFLFGRIYCSVICPMGVFQDCIIWLRRTFGELATKRQARMVKKAKAAGKPLPKIRKYRKTFSFQNPKNPLRLFLKAFFFIIAVASAISSGQLLISLIAPYSSYGRIVRTVTGLASGGQVAAALAVTAAITLVVIIVFAWIDGRGWCNTVCPVGTLLGAVSSCAVFRPRIDTDKCVDCGACVSKCKASCIDGQNHVIDSSRCVDCFDCIDNCSSGAISFAPANPFRNDGRSKKSTGEKAAGSGEADTTRRQFLATIAVLAGAGIKAAAQDMKLDGGLAEIVDKQAPERSERIVPPGAGSVKDFYRHCTACQLCVANCPNNVLRSSTDLDHFLQPQMGFEHGWCRPECTACGDVCPAGAIRPFFREEKLNIRKGVAQVNLELCVSASGKDSCGACSRKCPSGAIRMVRDEKTGHQVPVVFEEQCIGCGACEYLCPSRPISAITVSGLSTHINKC